MDLSEQIRLYVETEKLSFAETARRLGEGFTRHKVKNIYRKLRPYPRVSEGAVANETQTPFPTVEKIRERRATNSELIELKKLATKRAVIEELKEAISASQVARWNVPALLRPSQEKRQDRVGILLLSDIHLGQQTPARLTSGYEYSPAITERQFDSLFQQVLRESLENRWAKLIILDLGDTVDGDDMRASQHRLVGPVVVEQVTMYARLLSQLVTSLLLYIPMIHIERVPGNHARTSQRPGLAGLAEIDPMDSYDWLGGEFARESLREAIEKKRVSIVNHDTFYSTLEVFGYRVLFEHGSSLRGAGGSIGVPLAGLHRSLLGYRELEGEIDLYCLGHFHQPYAFNLFYNTTVVGNGAFPATSPFVMTTRKSAMRPSQALISLEKGRGVISIQQLWLDTPRTIRKVC